MIKGNRQQLQELLRRSTTAVSGWQPVPEEVGHVSGYGCCREHSKHHRTCGADHLLSLVEHHCRLPVPDTCATCRLLEVLSLGHNKLTALPDSLYSLTTVRELNVSHNLLDLIPDEIGQMEALTVSHSCWVLAICHRATDWLTHQNLCSHCCYCWDPSRLSHGCPAV